MPTKNIYYIIGLLILNGLLLLVPTGFVIPPAEHVQKVKARVVSVDNSLVKIVGVVRAGTQKLHIEVLDGTYRGQQTTAVNRLTGKLDLDKLFKKEDVVYASLKTVDNTIRAAIAHEYYRTDILLVLTGLFFLMIVAIAGFTGLRAVLTFSFTALFLWRVLFPAFLRGLDPIPTALAATIALSFVIIFSIAGFSRKGLTAFMGCISGIAITGGLSLLFGHLLHANGAIRPYSEMLLFTGFPAMKITDIFLAGIFIASSGAVMDVAMEIAASINELAEKKVSLSFKERYGSGMAVGKTVVGTMTTTLLLAYTGGYTFMFMTFIAQGKTVSEIANTQYISGEILHTLVGSFGLVLVAPITALFGALFLHAPTPSNRTTDNRRDQNA